jgi:calcineurin-like phosphoesterase family protein
MIETWFTSDTHYGHKNILEYEKEARPFQTLEEMHDVLVDRWNAVVGINDIVFHLGDFAFGKHNIQIASRLKGKKRLILGNHDKYSTSEYLKYFDKIYGVLFWERCILSHVPVHNNGLGARWLLNVHGHLHSRKVKRTIGMMMDVPQDDGRVVTISTPICEGEDPNYFNVSVEQNNLTPIHRDKIIERLEEIS